MTSHLNIAILADPLASFHPRKDSTLAMLHAARARGHATQLIEPGDLRAEDGRILARARPVEVSLVDEHPQIEQSEAETGPVSRFDILLVRKDPPFDLEYIYLTYLLEGAAREGVRVSNRPASLRSWNEKAALLRYPDLAPSTLITRRRDAVLEFLARHREIVLKPLDGMGGQSIFRLQLDDPNRSVILDTMLDDHGGKNSYGRKSVMAQQFLPGFREGDKRILLIGGEPQEMALNRVPAPGESRANLATGGHGVVVALDDRDRAICARLGPDLAAAGLDFVGIDVIGGKLTEINVTSPTGLREIRRDAGLDIADVYIEHLERSSRPENP